MSTGPTRAIEELRAELDASERKAWDSLARYKFWMFGYWAAIWVHLNRIGHFKRPNPWRVLVETARTCQPWPPKADTTPLLDEREPPVSIFAPASAVEKIDIEPTRRPLRLHAPNDTAEPAEAPTASPDAPDGDDIDADVPACLKRLAGVR